MATFALVHGAWHGAWCWEPLAGELRAAGHEAVAMDLPGDDPAAGFTVYAEVVIGALEGVRGDVVLVGHSLGGLTIPLVAARRPVSRLVYLCAIVPMPGRSHLDQVALEPDTLRPGALDGVRGGRWVDEAAARRVLFHDCPDEVARRAVERLRPQAREPYAEVCPLDAMPAVPAVYVLCRDDRVVDPAWSRRVARGRLGASLVELDGGHSPSLARPAELAAVLVEDSAP